jgi:2-keto-3-deoxy-L-fuconate dehydrogenase
MHHRLLNKRVLVTQADEYMGPAIVELFREEGAVVVANTKDLREPDAVARALHAAGPIDVLIANLAQPPTEQAATEIGDEQWQAMFDALCTPLMRLVRGVLPEMIARRDGKIVAMTSAAPLRGMPGFAAYCAARGAQNAFIRAVGLEVAPQNVQVNAIAQNYVKNPTYYPPDLVASERFLAHVARHVPSQRVAEGRESAELALFLASDNSDFMVGQVIPFAGGWATSG